MTTPRRRFASQRWGLVPISALLVFCILKANREPFLWLFVEDILHPPPLPVTIPLSPGLGVRLYTSTQPHIGKIARLQKDLVLLVDGKERVEEGFGFGLPLVYVDGIAYLTRTASVEHRQNMLVKRYELDIMDTPSGFLRQKYVPVPSVGSVEVAYAIKKNRIDVTVDLSGMKKPWEKTYIMNEQGAKFFTHYRESGPSSRCRWAPQMRPGVGSQNRPEVVLS
jgi:hypothetical protein